MSWYKNDPSYADTIGRLPGEGFEFIAAQDGFSSACQQADEATARMGELALNTDNNPLGDDDPSHSAFIAGLLLEDL